MTSNEKELNELENEEEVVVETSVPEDTVEDETVEPIEEAAEVVEETEDAVAEEISEDSIVEDDAEINTDANADVEAEGEEAYADAVAEETEISEEDVAVKDVLEDTPQKKSVAPIIALVAVVILVIAGVAMVLSGSIGGNKYNKMGYVNVSGRTIQDIADDVGITVEEFLAEYGLPEDMPADTTEIAAIYSMPAGVYVQTMIGVDYELVKTELGLPTETTPNTPKTLIEKIKAIFVKDKVQPIDENTPWYIVEGEMTVESYSGGAVDDFKSFYGLGEEVTGETKMKDIRDQINAKTAELLAEQQAAEEEAATGDETAEGGKEVPETTEGEETANDVQEETPAEETAE